MAEGIRQVTHNRSRCMWRVGCFLVINGGQALLLRFFALTRRACRPLSTLASGTPVHNSSGFHSYISISPPHRWSWPRTSHKSFVAELRINMTSSFIESSGGNFSPRIGLGYFWYIPIKSLILHLITNTRLSVPRCPLGRSYLRAPTGNAGGGPQ